MGRDICGEEKKKGRAWGSTVRGGKNQEGRRGKTITPSSSNESCANEN